MPDEDDGSTELGADDRAESADPDTDDTAGQALIWKVRTPVPAVDEDDSEGHAVQLPKPDVVPPALEEDDFESRGGFTRPPRNKED
jgi:hypothetical protein